MSCMDVCAAYAIEPWIQLTMLEKNNEKTRDLIAFLSIILFKNFKSSVSNPSIGRNLSAIVIYINTIGIILRLVIVDYGRITFKNHG